MKIQSKSRQQETSDRRALTRRSPHARGHAGQHRRGSAARPPHKHCTPARAPATGHYRSPWQHGSGDARATPRPAAAAHPRLQRPWRRTLH